MRQITFLKNSPFIRSFKLDKRFLSVLLIEWAFIILILLSIPLYTFILRLNMDKMRPLDDSAKRVSEMMKGNLELDDKLTQDFDLVTSALNLFWLKMTVISILFLAAIIIAAAYTKGLTWSKILKQRFKQKVYLKFSLLITIWNLIWVMLFLITIYGFKFNIDTITKILIFGFILYFYFNSIVPQLFFRSKSILKTIKQVFSLGITKFYILVPAYSIIFIILIIISWAIILLIQLTLIQPLLALVFITLIASIFIAWTKFYMYWIMEMDLLR